MESPGSPYQSYAEFAAGDGVSPMPGYYSYVTFPTLDGIPSGGKWDEIQVGDTWRIDSGESEWVPTSNLTGSTTANLIDQTGTLTLKSAGSDTVTNWLQSFRNNLKEILGGFDRNGKIKPENLVGVVKTTDILEFNITTDEL
jgi:hypothetical protein